MARNKLSDLNNHLFAQLEKLGEEQLTGDELKEELSRARAIADLGTVIVNNAKLTLSAMKYADETKKLDVPDQLKLE